MFSVLLQGEGGGGGGGYHGGGYTHYGSTLGGGSCDTTCVIVIVCVVCGVVLVPCLLLIVYRSVRNSRTARSIQSYQQQATLDMGVKAADRPAMLLAVAGQPACRTLTVQATTTYRGHTANNRAERVAVCELTLDNDSSARTLAGSGVDAWGQYDIRGTFMLDAPTHGRCEFAKSYASYKVRYAGEIDAAQQPLSVTGSWHTEAGTGDGGPFSMTFAQPLHVVDMAPVPEAVALAVDAGAAAYQQQPPVQQSSEYRLPSEMRSTGSPASSASVSEVEMAPTSIRAGL